MRIRLAHTQALVLLSAVLLTLLCMGALTAWNLRHGFSEFLAVRDVERLEQFAALVSEQAAQAGGLDALAAQDDGFQQLLRAFGRTHSLTPRPPHRPPDAHPEDVRPPPRGREDFRERVAIYNLNGQALWGQGLPPDLGPVVERPLVVRGDTVGLVRMLKLKPVPSAVESHFLTSQYQSMLGVSGLLLLAALLGARWVSAHWVRPLIDIQTATQQIAQGALETRLSTTRTDELGDAARNINRMAEGLQQIEASRRQWIANMSHELRTPLTVLRGEMDALIDGVIPNTPQALLSLREEVLKLNALVDDLHLLAMADLKALPCYFEELDAVFLLHHIAQRFALQAQQRGLTLELDTGTLQTLTVHWDAKRMEQLLGNLLDNSLRYTHAPGLLRLSLIADGEQVLIRLEDSAPGLSAQDLSRVFEPLFRAEASRSRHAGGSGLGLSICEQIAKAHQGHISASASTLGGVLMTLTLPQDAGQPS